MTTLLVSNDFLPQVGGIQTYTDNILRRLPGAAAFVAANPAAATHDDTAPYPVIRGPRRYLFPTPSVERALRKAVEEVGADVLLFATPWPLVGLGKRLGMPTAVCTHGAELIMPAKVAIGRAALGHALKQADLLYTVSAHTGHWVRRTVGNDGPPIRYLRPGVPLDIFTPAADGAMIRDRHDLGDDPVVVCVGRLVRRKGQDVLVRAWPQVRAAVPNARLVLVGPGPLEDDLRKAAARQPDGAVTVAGRVAWEDLPRYHVAADVFAHPNRTRLGGLESEGFGVIFLEAAACGTATIAGNSGGAPEAIIPGETGVLVDGTDDGAVATAVIELLTDPARARAMGQRGRTFVEEHFDWRQIVDRLEDDLVGLVAGDLPDTEL